MNHETPDQEFRRKMAMGDYDYINKPIPPTLVDHAIGGGLKLTYLAVKGLWHGGKWLAKKAIKQK